MKIFPDFGDLVEDLGLPSIVAVILLPVLLPTIGKPMAKTVVKGAIVLYEKSKRIISPVSARWEDIIAEAKAELAQAKPKELQESQSRI